MRVNILKSWALILIALNLGIYAAIRTTDVHAQTGVVAVPNGGLLYASDFGQWTLPQGSSPSSGMIQWTSASICRVTSGSFTFVAPKVGRPITIVDIDPAHTETTTPTNVIISNSTCTVSAPMLYTHLNYSVRSGTQGLQEAIDYANVGTQLAQVLITPLWGQMGGTTAMITAAKGTANISMLDQRSSSLQSYNWNGSAYVGNTITISGCSNPAAGTWNCSGPGAFSGVSIAGNVDAGGQLSGASASVAGNANVGGTLSAGATTVVGNGSFGGNVLVAGAQTVASQTVVADQTVGGASHITGVASGGAVDSAATLAAYTPLSASALQQIKLGGYSVGSNMGGGVFQWVAAASVADGCINIAPSADPTGASGVWQRAGGYTLTITPEMCGALGDTASFTGSITASSAVLSGTGFTASMVGQSVSVAGAGTSGNTMFTTVLSYQNSSQITLNATASTTVTSATVYIGTDDTTALQRAHALLVANSAANIRARLEYGPKTYMTRTPLAMPAGNGSGLGGDLWEITANGTASILQISDNTPIMRQRPPAGGTSRKWRMSNLRFLWATNQASICDWNNKVWTLNCDSIAVEFDPQGSVLNGSLQWDMRNLEFVNGYRGISISPAAITSNYSDPVWGFTLHNIMGDTAMSGTVLYLGGYINGGGTRAYMSNIYLQDGGIFTNWRKNSDNGYGMGQECAISLVSMDGVVMDSIEMNLGANCQLGLTAVEAEINQLRFEAEHLTFGNAAQIVISSSAQFPVTINGLKEKALHADFQSGNVAYLLSAIGAQVNLQDAAFEDDYDSAAVTSGYQSGTTFTVPAGGIASGTIYTGATLTIPGFTTEHIVGGSAPVWTVDVSQSFGTPSVPISNIAAANPTTGNVYIATTASATGIDPIHMGHITFGKGLNFNAIQGRTITHTFPYQSGPPYTSAGQVDFVKAQTLPTFNTIGVLTSGTIATTTFTSVGSPALLPGMTCSGTGVSTFHIVSGATNTWTIDVSQTVASTTPITCTTPTLSASMPSTNVLLANSADGTWVAPKDGFITRIEVINSSTITAGTLSFLPTVTTAAGFTASISATTLTTSGIINGPILPQQLVTGSGVSANTHIVAQLSANTWSVDVSQTVASTAMTASLTENVTSGLAPGVTGGTQTYRVAAPWHDTLVPISANTGLLTSHFFAGSKIGMRLSTDGSFAPVGQSVTVILTVMYI